jgi:hypothetical protein
LGYVKMRSSIDTALARARALAAIFVVGGLMLLPINGVHATRVYKSIDAKGHVTYSSSPQIDAIETERIDVSTDYDAGTSTAHQAIIDEIRAAATQLEEDRKQREQARETARNRVQESEAKKQAATPAQPVINYYPVNPLGFVRPHRPRPPRHRPPHPVSPRGQHPAQQTDSDQQ